MGGVEDDEPPSKRVKASSGESTVLSNGVSLASCSVTDSMARLLASSKEDDEVVGTKGIVKKVELVRIIAEALYSLGYSKTGARLEEESGIPLHSAVVDSFMQQILDGQWDESVATLHKIGLIDKTIIKLASFVILEQKFFELLDGEKVMDALKTMRTEIAPLHVNDDRVRELSSYIVSPSGKALKLKSRKKLLEELQKLLPPTIMIPEKRLVHLVEQALDLQKDACRFHNLSLGGMSLLTDHQCGTDQIPSKTVQLLQEHSGDVWFLQFSHNGKYLASSASDRLVIIWEINVDGQFSLKHRLSGHQKPVTNISFSPDDSQFLTCGLCDSVRRWDVSSGNCLNLYEKTGFGLVSCGWAPDGKHIYCGVTDKSIVMYDLEGKEIECWKGQRTVQVADLEVTPDGKELVTACAHNTVLLFNLETKHSTFIEVDHNITSFALSEDGKLLLVSLSNGELHLWSSGNDDGCPKVVSKYKGHKRSRFVVRACFGGLEQAFIASGSEDSQVYIWHRISGELISTLAGHSGSVNCVSWNPGNPHMLATGSDDRTIRIWGINQVNTKQNGNYTNGVHSNGGRT